MLKFILGCFSCKESNTLSNDIPIKQKEISPSTEEAQIKEGTSVSMLERPLEFHCVQNSKTELTEHSISVNTTSNKSIVMIKSKESSKRDPIKAKRKILLDECF